MTDSFAQNNVGVRTDFHMHTHGSFDGRDTALRMGETADERGIERIALTDHCDIDCIEAGIYPPYYPEKIRAEIDEAREKCRCGILYGIELGQGYLCREASEKLLRENEYDYVLGSVHNLEGVPDFGYLHYEFMPRAATADLYRRYLDDILTLVRWEKCDTIAHIGYPIRYITRAGAKLTDPERFEEQLRRIFEEMIRRETVLEINTSGLRAVEKFTMPNNDILSIYRDCGGKLITFGSDAHSSDDLGKGIAEAAQTAKELGFTDYVVFGRGHKRELRPL